MVQDTMKADILGQLDEVSGELFDLDRLLEGGTPDLKDVRGYVIRARATLSKAVKALEDYPIERPGPGDPCP